ncbi:MFS transporter [uncultured Bartonella sp.]|uniref:MFS transporter n=1 Tax=uncultured Bartonella sp. TaxID=104108 RepID=UPI0025CE93A6|nr:MFS transporter [uncultured Bartonella sp.]
MTITKTGTGGQVETTFISIIFAVSCGHFLNDVMQSMLPAIYPILRNNYGLTFLQIGIITAVYQMTGSVLQPLIGFYTDKKPSPYSLPFASASTMIGLLLLANAHHYYILLIGSAFVGLGSSIFHPEASRVARLASGGKYGVAQSIFQVGGNCGSAIGPVIAAAFISQQQRIGWLSILAFFGIIILTFVSHWYANNLKRRLTKKTSADQHLLPKAQVRNALFVLVGLMFAKYVYMASMQNYYMFYTMEKFGVSLHQAQLLLFLYLGGIAIGTIFGGPIGDRIGARTVIWVSILGVFPFTVVLPYVNLPSTAILTVIIGMILASAFPAIVVFAQELMPGKVGTVAGLFFGLSFGIGALSSAALGWVMDIVGSQTMFEICSYMPALGLIAIFLPKIRTGRA